MKITKVTNMIEMDDDGKEYLSCGKIINIENYILEVGEDLKSKYDIYIEDWDGEVNKYSINKPSQEIYDLKGQYIYYIFDIRNDSIEKYNIFNINKKEEVKKSVSCNIFLFIILIIFFSTASTGLLQDSLPEKIIGAVSTIILLFIMFMIPVSYKNMKVKKTQTLPKWFSEMEEKIKLKTVKEKIIA